MLRSRMILLLIFTLPFSSCGFVMWSDYVDPPFIPAPRYDFLMTRLLPVICVILSVIIFAWCFRQFKRDANYRRTIKSQIEDEGKFRSVLYVAFMPVLVYMFFWGLTSAPIRLWGNYFSDIPWSKEYVLTRVDDCDQHDYGIACSYLNLRDLQSGKTIRIRWYNDETRLRSMKEQYVYLSGVQGPFGALVETIQWY